MSSDSTPPTVAEITSALRDAEIRDRLTGTEVNMVEHGRVGADGNRRSATMFERCNRCLGYGHFGRDCATPVEFASGIQARFGGYRGNSGRIGGKVGGYGGGGTRGVPDIYRGTGNHGGPRGGGSWRGNGRGSGRSGNRGRGGYYTRVHFAEEEYEDGYEIDGDVEEEEYTEDVYQYSNGESKFVDKIVRS
ncbi:hypothetical protein HDU93_002663, partial [Gonapodya sp. JEL0774]